MIRSWAITTICAGLLVFAPLAFGSVEVWSKTVLQVGAILLLLLLFLPRSGIRRRPRPLAPLVIAGVFLVLVIFHLVPLPTGTVSALSPRNVELKAIGSETAESASGGGSAAKDTFRFTTLSMYPEATKNQLLPVLTYALVFLSIGYARLRRPQRLTLYATVICMGFAIALIGLLQRFSGTDKILWLRMPRYGGSFFGPFVNRNHFAGFTNMCIGLALGALVGMLRPWRMRRLKGRGEIVDYLAGREVGLSLLLIFALAVMSASVFACASRGGVISLAASFLVIFAIVASSSKHRKSLLLVVPLILVAFGASLLLADEAAFHRLATIWRILEIETEATGTSRPAIWNNTLDIARDFPIIGAGLGTFCFVYPIYRSFYTPAFCLHAHGDWFELPSEMGIMGLLLVLGFSVAFVIYAAKALRRCRDPLAWGLIVGGLAAFTAIFVHSFVDFNLHVPSNALYLTLIMALTIATSRRHRGLETHEREYDSDDVFNGRTHFALGKRIVWVIVILAGAGLWAWQLTCSYRAQHNLERFRSLVSAPRKTGTISGRGKHPDVGEILELAGDVTKCAGRNAEYHFEVGRELLFLATGPESTSGEVPGPLERLQILDASYEAFRQACKLNPIMGEYHFWLGQSYAAVGLNGAAEEEFAKATALFPSDRQMRIDIAQFYRRIGKPEKTGRALDAAESIQR